MYRISDWRIRLAALIVERRRQPFVWGTSDCCLLAADGVRAMTGFDFAGAMRGYTTRFGALRSLKRAGFDRVFDAVDAAGLPVAGRARTGDVIGIPAWPLDALMIADGSGAAWGQEEGGLVRLPIPSCAIIWSV